ncbi:MAG: DUF1292 domain-containing protein [Clostridia bacterium]|nr:DUF1292 domain-containing protein [Clostridia bacterium]
MEELNTFDEIIMLTDENGEETAFEHVLTFLHEGERYVALVPVVEDASFDENEEAEVVLLKIEHKDGEDVYVSIDNEVMLNEVFEAFIELMEEIEEEENK